MLIEGERGDWRKLRRRKKNHYWEQEEVFEQTNIKKYKTNSWICLRRGREISTYKRTNKTMN